MNIADRARAFAGVEEWLAFLCRCTANTTGVDLGCDASAGINCFMSITRTIVNGAVGGHEAEFRGGGSSEDLREKRLRVSALTNHTLIPLSANSSPPPPVGAMDVVGRLSHIEATLLLNSLLLEKANSLTAKKWTKDMKIGEGTYAVVYKG